MRKPSPAAVARSTAVQATGIGASSTPVTVRPSEMQQQLEALHESLCSLHATANRLVDGLAPVLKPTPVDPQRHEVAAAIPDGQLSPVGESIRSFTARVDEVKHLLEEASRNLATT